MPSSILLEWQPSTLTLIERGAGYGRMIRLRDKSLLCSYEKGGKSWVCLSRDEGRTWQPPRIAAESTFGNAANPETLQLRSGRLLLFYNLRPHAKSENSPRARFAIGMVVSNDNGITWQQQTLIFEADRDPRNGCWEPAALQLPSGEIQLFFANEFPYTKSDEQEISLCRSRDEGKTWSKPQAAIFRARHRDGMPVPLLLQNGSIAVAIEDNGLADKYILQPAIITTSLKENWQGPAAGGDSPRRWGAVIPPLAAEVYVGAPYLRQLTTGETLLSCQSIEGRIMIGGKKTARMVVYVGDSNARNFANPSLPFLVADTTEGLWNSLFIKDASTVTALSSTAISGMGGLWAIDGRVLRNT